VTADPVLHHGRTRGDRRLGDLLIVPVRLGRVEARGRLIRTRAPVLVLAMDRRWGAVLPGQSLALTGRLGPAETGQPVAAVISVRGPPSLRGRPPPVQRAAVRCAPGSAGRAPGCLPTSAACSPDWSWGTPRECPRAWSTTFGRPD
jgi:competence protein ComEC